MPEDAERQGNQALEMATTGAAEQEEPAHKTDRAAMIAERQNTNKRMSGQANTGCKDSSEQTALAPERHDGASEHPIADGWVAEQPRT